MVRASALLAAGLLLVSTVLLPAHADDQLDEVLVDGEQPGPGLWQVRHGDHTLWVLGTVSPLPAKMTWRSKEVETRVASSDALVTAVDVKADISKFTALRMLPSLLRAGKLPKGQTLATVLEPALFARWAVLRDRYMPGNDSVEKTRPVFAAGQLYEAALKKAGLSGRNVVRPKVYKAAEAAGILKREPEITIHVEDPRGLLREFTESPPGNELVCFENLLDRVEKDLPRMQQRAEAWATGDIPSLRKFAAEAVDDRCLDFLSTLPRISKEINAARERATREFMLAVEGALLRNPNSFVMLPMEDVLGDKGTFAQLRSKGYEIVEPPQ